MGKHKIEPFYALYKGDRFIDLGTKKYLSELLNVSPKTIAFFLTPTYKKRIEGSKDRIIVIRIEEDISENNLL